MEKRKLYVEEFESFKKDGKQLFVRTVDFSEFNILINELVDFYKLNTLQLKYLFPRMEYYTISQTDDKMIDIWEKDEDVLAVPACEGTFILTGWKNIEDGLV